LETIRLHRPITRGEIARKLGMTVQTVSTIIRELELPTSSSAPAKAVAMPQQPCLGLV
jgi:hypothetical protein